MNQAAIDSIKAERDAAVRERDAMAQVSAHWMHKASDFEQEIDTLREVARQSLKALCLPCDRWNKTQSNIVMSAIATIEGILK